MIDLLFVMLPHSCALDWAGPAEAFRIANQTLERQGKPAAFRMRFVGPDVQAVSSVGAQFMKIESLPKKFDATPRYITRIAPARTCWPRALMTMHSLNF